jgi:hypothetical protein
VLIFSPKAKQAIDQAVGLLSAPERAVWLRWTQAHPEVRGPNQPRDDSRGPLSGDLVAVVLKALELQRAEYRLALAMSELREDDILDIETAISHLKSVERALYDNIGLNRKATAA